MLPPTYPLTRPFTAVSPLSPDPAGVVDVLHDLGLAIGSQFSPTLMVRRGLKKEFQVAALMRKNKKYKILTRGDKDAISDLAIGVDVAKEALPDTTWIAILRSPADTFSKSRQYLGATKKLHTGALSISSRAWIAAALSSGEYECNPPHGSPTGGACEATAGTRSAKVTSDRSATLPPTAQPLTTSNLVVHRDNPDDPPPPYESVPHQGNPLVTHFNNVRVDPDGVSQVSLRFGGMFNAFPARSFSLSLSHRDLTRNTPTASFRPVVLSGTATLVPRDIDTSKMGRDDVMEVLPDVVAIKQDGPQGYDIVVTDIQTLEISDVQDHDPNRSACGSQLCDPHSSGDSLTTTHSTKLSPEPDHSPPLAMKSGRAHGQSLSGPSTQVTLDPGTQVRSRTGYDIASCAPHGEDLERVGCDRSAGYLYGLLSRKDECRMPSRPDAPPPVDDQYLGTDLEIRVSRWAREVKLQDSCQPPDDNTSRRARASREMQADATYNTSTIPQPSPPAKSHRTHISKARPDVGSPPVTKQPAGRPRTANLLDPVLGDRDRDTRTRSLSPLPTHEPLPGASDRTTYVMKRDSRLGTRPAHARSISDSSSPLDSLSTVYNGNQYMLTPVLPGDVDYIPPGPRSYDRSVRGTPASARGAHCQGPIVVSDIDARRMYSGRPDKAVR